MNYRMKPIIFLGVILGIVAVILLLAPEDNATNTATISQSSRAQTIDKSPETQRKRQEFIDSMIRQGVFEKVEMKGSAPYVWVRPRNFASVDFESKQTALSIVYAFYFNDVATSNIVHIRDAMNGKSVGYYSIHGLRIY